MNSKKHRSPILIAFVAILFVFLAFRMLHAKTSSHETNPLITKAIKRSFPVDVKTVGELEATRSTIISSSIRGDLGKIIYLIDDGATVKEGEILIRMDPTPFEEKVEELESNIREQQTIIEANEQLLKSEISQAEHEKQLAEYDLESAEMEYNKTVRGDGPMEIARLQSAMLKAKAKYEELVGYCEDLEALEKEGFLNLSEKKQAFRKLEDEKEAYESASHQYNTFVEHVHPMQVKKAESSLNRSKVKKEDTLKSCAFKIGKAYATLEYSKQELEALEFQMRNARAELAQTLIIAPTAGMVVQREEYRSGQRRKPRVGDVLIKNQPLLDLPDLRSITVKTKVREVDLHKIELGKKTTIEVDAYPDLILTGTVQWIGILAQSEAGRGNEEKHFEVKVLVDTPDERLRPGMTARLIIHAAEVNQGLSVPIHAVFYKNRKPYCLIQRRTTAEMTPIELGICNEQWATILSGIHEGETLYLTFPEKTPVRETAEFKKIISQKQHA